MRKPRLDAPHTLACITYQTLEFPLLISRVHEKVMILFVPLLAACPTGSYGEGCNQTCSCRNDGICHPVSGRCACMAGWTGPNCTEGQWTQRRAEQSSIWQVNKGPQDVFFCVFFSQNALQGFMEQTVGSAACVRMEPPVVRPTENVLVPADGWAQPVNWVRLLNAVSNSLCMCYHKTTFRWTIGGKTFIYYNLGFFLVLLPVIYNNILKFGNADVATATADGEET